MSFSITSKFRKTLIVLGLSCFLSACAQSHQKTNTINSLKYDALELYFNIVDKLQDGNTVSEEEWTALFNTETHQTFFKDKNISENTKKAYKQAILITFTEKNDSIINQKAQENSNILFQLRYRKNYKKIKEFAASLINNPNTYRKAMTELAEKYLPKRMHGVADFPTIYFHVFGEPSAGYKGIYLDLGVEYDCNQIKYASMAAHELHHSLRSSIVPVDNKRGLIYAIDAIQNEGLADLVNYPALMSDKSDWWMKPQFQPIIEYCPRVIEELDTMIQEEINGKRYSIEEYSATLMGGSGHIPGYYMGFKIAEAGKESDIIETADNPFLFFKIYNESIPEGDIKTPRFSETSIKYILSLQPKQ